MMIKNYYYLHKNLKAICMYKLLKSLVLLAQKRNVSSDVLLKDKSDIDSYFYGNRQMKGKEIQIRVGSRKSASCNKQNK